MANYTTSTSDKSKGKALNLFYCGGFGILGLHFFYVGRYKRGFVNLVVAFFVLLGFIALWSSSVHTDTGLAITFGEKLGPTVCALLVLAAINLPTFIQIKAGTYRDNVGNPLRD